MLRKGKWEEKNVELGGINDNQSNSKPIFRPFGLSAKAYDSIPKYIFIEPIHVYILHRYPMELTSWRVGRIASYGALINYHQLSDNMLFATELTNECTLYLITRLTPRAHPHGGPTSDHFYRRNIPSVAPFFLSHTFFFFHPFTCYLVQASSCFSVFLLLLLPLLNL